ncbi:MAG TPA: hypothetical protein VK904_00215, partial [Miltoncostaeaceae bacterium]|nr:hypothetical protein [Miltoncostaeaceae bacterium]
MHEGARSLEVAGREAMNPVEETIRRAPEREIGASTASAAGARPARWRIHAAWRASALWDRQVQA